MFDFYTAFNKVAEENEIDFEHYRQGVDTTYYTFGNSEEFTTVLTVSIQVKDEKVVYKVWVKGKPWTGLSGNSKGTEIIHIADPVKHQQVINKIAELLKEAATAE